MKCPYCEKTISQVSEVGMKMDALSDSRFFPEEIQDIGEEFIRKTNYNERFLIGLLELAYRRGQAGSMEQMEYPEQLLDQMGQGKIKLENVISSLMK